MSFSEALARKIEARFRNLETSMVRYRRGTVTGTSPLQVDLGASGNSVDANALTTGLDVNDEVHALAWGNDLLVLGPSDGPTVVDTFPSSPRHNEIAVYASAAMHTAGQRWQLQYDANDDYWYYLGGARLYNNGTGTSGLALSGYTVTDWTTSARVTVPLAGDYELTGNVNAYTTSGTVQELVLRIGASSGSTTSIASVTTGTTTGTVVAPAGTVTITGLAASATPQLWVASGGGTWTIQYGRMYARPIRVQA